MISLKTHRANHPKYNLWLIHGYGESHACFNLVFQSPLAKEANIFSFDLPGFGVSPLIKSGYEAYIQELAQVIEAQNRDLPCVILGHSLGGLIATLVVAQLKIDQKILLVVDSVLPSDQSLMTKTDIGAVESPQAFKENLLLSLKVQMATQPDIARLVTHAEASDPESLAYWAKEWVRARENDRVLNLFLNLTCLKYYLIGERSFTLPSRQRVIELLTEYLIWFPNAGHWIMLDTPAVFWQQVSQLLKMI